MITLKEINKLIEESIKQRKTEELTDRKQTRLKDATDFYRLVKAYVETQPSESYVEKEIDRIGKRLALIDEGYSAWLKSNQIYSSDPKKVYYKEMGATDLKKQLEALEFIYQPAKV